MLLSLIFCCAPPVLATNIETVPIGNVGNGPDTEVAVDDTNGYGSVSYVYEIGKYEVTNEQWIEFLAVKAAVGDPLGLYNTNMAVVGVHGGGIDRQGTGTALDPYTYSPKGGDAAWNDRPVNFVSYWDAMRFTNWLHNGQGSGDTEDGAYTLLGNSQIPTNGPSVVRNPGALRFLPSEDEWYKAAYHKNDGNTANYFDFPTASDLSPNNLIADPDPGNNSNSYIDDYSTGAPYYSTTAGEYENSGSAYGTFDQGGNLWEWNEALFGSWTRGIRGGSWGMFPHFQHASRRGGQTVLGTSQEFNYIGFRIASVVVPEPTTLLMVASAGFGLLMRPRRFLWFAR